jgi:hypothetical protein
MSGWAGRVADANDLQTHIWFLTVYRNVSGCVTSEKQASSVSSSSPSYLDERHDSEFFGLRSDRLLVN